MPKKITSPPTEGDSILDLAVPVTERDGIISALLYGRSGTGKTAISGTFPKPALLIDIRERGSDTVANVQGLDLLSVTTYDQVVKAFWDLNARPHKYKTVILDQLTTLQDVCMDEVRREEDMEAHDLMNRKDWGNLSGKMKTLISQFGDLIDKKVNVVFIAHDREDDADDGGGDNQLMPSIGPRVMPSVASFLCGQASMIGYTYIRERFVGEDRKRLVEYCLRIGPHASYVTKVRHPREVETVDVVVNPTYDKIIAVIKGEKKEPKKLTRRK